MDRDVRMIPRPPAPDSVPEIPEVPRPVTGPERVPPRSTDLWDEIENIKKRLETLEKSFKELVGKVTKLEKSHKA